MLEFSAEEAAQSFVLAEEFPQRHQDLARHIEDLWQGQTCSLYSCSDCGLRFAWPFVAGDGEFYNLAYPYSAYPAQRWEFDQTAAAVPLQSGRAGRLLEIGSGFGYFLRKVSPAKVPPSQVLAVEYSDTARAQLSSLGYTPFGVDIRSAEFDRFRNSVSTVCMFQVLEHMDRLDEVVVRLNELMLPGAQLFIAVPNAVRIQFNETHGSLYDMPPNHISVWTERSFRALADRAGWRLLDYQVEPLSWQGLLREDLVYSHMRRAQASGSLANRVRAFPRSTARVAAEGVLAVLAAPARLKAWADAWGSRGTMGGSVWVHLQAPAAQ